jgi:hypothetical protein
MTSRPLVWLLTAAGLAALGLAVLPGDEPVPAPAAAPSDGSTTAARSVLHVIGLAAPVATDAPVAGRADEPDPSAAIEVLAQRLRGRDAEAALPQLEALARRWPARALPLYEDLLNRWAVLRQFPQALQALARATLDAQARQRLQEQLLARWAEAAPEQAARWTLSTPGQAELLAPLHDRWLQQDARSATVFASTLPRGEARQALLTESLSRWTAQDGPGARDWLRSQGAQPELDDAIARHASADELARYAPFEAMDLVARIATPDRRWQAWQALAQSLYDIDPERVAPLLAHAPGLLPKDRARLLDELR